MERTAFLVLDALSAPIAILDDIGTILSINRAWRGTTDTNCPLLGKVDEGVNYLQYLETANGNRGHAATFAAGIRGVIQGDSESFAFEYRCLVGGEQCWFIGRVTRYIEHRAVRVLVIHEDITQRKLAEETVTRFERHLSVLAETAPNLAEQLPINERIIGLQAVTAALSEALTPSQVADAMITKGSAVLGAASGTVALLNDEGTMLGLVAATGYSARETSALEAWRVFPANVPVPVAEPSQTRQPIWIESPDMWSERYPHLAAELDTIPHKAWAIVPLIFQDRVLGTLSFAYGEPRTFSEDDKNFIQTLALQCAHAIQRAILFEREQQARIEAEAAVKVRENFLSIAAHELRTPLTSIYGNIQLLQRYANRNDETSREKQQRLLAQVSTQTRRFNRMIEELLDITRLVRGQLTITRSPMDFVALVQRVVNELQPHLTHHKIECVLPDTPMMIDGDEFRLEQVLQNLLQNAVKYSPKGGRIIVQGEQRDDSACILITDEGIGIPEEAIPELFKRFYRADNVGAGIGGLGIGLYLVRELVSLHGGTVDVTSTEGKGSTFTVCIPLHTE